MREKGEGRREEGEGRREEGVGREQGARKKERWMQNLTKNLASEFDDEILYKVAGHELKSLSCLVDCQGNFFLSPRAPFIKENLYDFLFFGDILINLSYDLREIFGFFEIEFNFSPKFHDIVIFLILLVPGLFFPFMAVIEYLGYRLIAMTCLPLNKNSLKVGTCDQGRNFFYDDKVGEGGR
jgi:hypothetical protein